MKDQTETQAGTILKKLESMRNPANVNGMARFGIIFRKVMGINKPLLDKIARQTGKDHKLARMLWNSEIYEAMVLAALIDDPKSVTENQMEKWAMDFDNWGVCDNACMNLFDKTPFAYRKAFEWSYRKEEFVKRAGFVLMASLAIHDKAAKDSVFLKFLPAIRREAVDERNFVKKAVNWALRNIGKRNAALNKAAIKAAEEILRMDSKAARWIANDALRELTHERIRKRLKHKPG